MGATKEAHIHISKEFCISKNILSLYKILERYSYNSKLNRKDSYDLLKKTMQSENSSLQTKLDQITTFNNEKDLFASVGGKFRPATEYLFHNKDNAKAKINEGKTTGEKLIQRLLFFNESKYRKELGTLLGYEVVISSLGRKFPIDLIGCNIKGQQIIFNLIEMKTCAYPEKPSPDSKLTKESQQLLICPIFEIATYARIFQYVYKNDNGQLKNAIRNLLPVAFSNVDFDNPIINKIVLGPQGMIDELKDVEQDLNLDGFTFIELKSDSVKKDDFGYPEIILSTKN